MSLPPESLVYLWEYRTLYIGELGNLSTMNQGAASLVIGIEGEFEFWGDDEHSRIRSKSALIPAGFKFNIDTFDLPVACCYLDPVGADFAAFRLQMKGEHEGVFYDSCAEMQQVQGFLNIRQHEWSGDRAYAELMNVIFPPLSLRETIPKADERIWNVIGIIKREPLINHSSAELAERVGLSENQLQRLFKSTTGLPVRRYRLWHRLFVTATYMGFGYTLTNAALASGFSDSSHFNHTFKSMLGMKPSFVLRRSDNIKIFTGGDDGVCAERGLAS